MREPYQLKETIVTISADEQAHIEAAKEAIKGHRADLERYISYDPFFQTTLDPYESQGHTPEIVTRMIRASTAVGLGPMSAVAGTIAALAVEAMVEAGASYAVVDNGGDIALATDRPVTIGIYAGESPIRDIAFHIQPHDGITGICTSSGTVGPSISFGEADMATVFSPDVSLADAAATALGNAVGDDLEASFTDVMVKGITGAVVIKGDRMATWGQIPEIVRARLRPDLITRA